MTTSTIQPGPLTLPAAALGRAKINLTLRITGRTANGYHLLDSVVGFADLGDLLTLTALSPGGPDRLTLEGQFGRALAAEPDNLVLRAAGAMRAWAMESHALAAPASASFTLDKRLPVASGIGGGSADAAAALRLLRRAWALDAVPLTALVPLAKTLGADVPVCLLGEPARMRGIGDLVEPLTDPDQSLADPLPAAPLVLVNPGVPVETRAVFAARTGEFSPPLLTLPPLRTVEDLAGLVQRGGNDLAAPALQLCPPIAKVLQALHRQPGCLAAAVSGSGGTCFGIFRDIATRDAAAGTLKTGEPGWWVASTRLAPTGPR